MKQIKALMKSKYYVSFLLFLLLSVSSCNGSNKENKSVDIPSINMNEAKVVDFNGLVEDVICTVLEDSPDAFLSDSWKMMKHKEFFYLYSLSNFSVSIYDNDGLFVKRIDGKGNGAIDMPSDIFIDEKEGQLWIIDSRCFINKYTLRGEFINKEQLPFFAVKIAQTNKGNYLFYDGGFDKETDYYMRQTSSDFKTTNSFIKKTIEGHREMPVSLFTNDYINNNIYALPSNNDTIYITDKDEHFRPYFHLDFGGKLLTFKEFPEKGFKDKEMAEIINKREKIYSIRGFYFTSGLLFMQLHGEDNSYRAIDVETQTAYKFKTLIDNVSFSSQVTSIQGSTRNSLLLSIPANKFLDEYSRNNNQTQYASIKKVLDNPESVKNRVLIEIKIKNNL